LDKKAKRILMQTFWGAGGWKPGNRVFAGDEFEYARNCGLMFDPLTITHDELIGRIIELHESITLDQVSAAFLHSLSTRQTHLRSALSSWSLTRDLTEHTYRANLSDTGGCQVCTEQELIVSEQYSGEDLNVLNFERIKWGGIRLNWLLYCWFDLDQFSREAPVDVTDEDVAILRRMLDEVRACSPADSARKLEQRWKDVFPSSKNERDVVMEVLGYAGLLEISNLPRIGRRTDNDFMAMDGWQGQDGYNPHTAARLFGKWGVA